MYTQWNDNVYILRWKDMSFILFDARSIPLIYWRSSIYYQGNSHWSWRWYLVVIRLVTINIYVIHWDTLSYTYNHWYHNDGSAQGVITLLYVILCCKLRNIGICRVGDRDVCESSTLIGRCIWGHQSGKRCQKSSRHSPNTNRAPHWNFYAMHRIHCISLNFIQFHWKTPQSLVLQGFIEGETG